VTGFGEFSSNARLFTLGSFLKITEVAHIMGLLFHDSSFALISTLNGLGDFFTSSPGTDVMIFTIFLKKKLAKNWCFWLKTKLNFEKYLIITLVFKKNAIFCRENWKKSQKIMIIASTSGRPEFSLHRIAFPEKIEYSCRYYENLQTIN
jgi:hypothetical protein